MTAPARTTFQTDAPTTPIDLVAVFAYNTARGDFDPLPAVRRTPDEYELLEASEASGFAAGDIVRCELSDGELIVRERIYGTRLL